MYDIIIYVIIVVLIVRFLFVHIKYPFWSCMPVHHVYDFMFLKQPFPMRHKYTNPLLIKSIPFLDLNDTYLKYFVELLQASYIQDDTILYTMEQKHARAYLTGHNDPTFVSFYCNPIYKAVNTEDLLPAINVSLVKEPVGCAASYPVTMNGSVRLNYITFIGAKEDKVVRELIATHDYNVRRHNPDIQACLIKKEAGACDGVKPLLTFHTKMCLIPRFLCKATSGLCKVKEIVQVYRQNWDVTMDLLHSLSNCFSITIDIGALKARIDAQEWYVYAYCYRGVTLAMYFIEDAHMLYEETGHKALRLVASINNGLDPVKFNAGFQDCLRRIVKSNLDFKMVIMDCIGDTKQIQMDKTLWQTSGAYYLINMAQPNAADEFYERAFVLV